MAMIVDVNRNTCFTADHLVSHKIVVSKDSETCREMHLYGAEMPLGLKYLDTVIVDFDDIDWDFEGEYGVQLPRISGNPKTNKIRCDIEEGFNLATPPPAIIKLNKPTKNGKWYIPLNGRTRKSILKGDFSFTNCIFDVYSLTEENFKARLRVAGFSFNKPSNPSQAVTKNELLTGVREAILLGEEGLVPEKNKAGDIDQEDLLNKIRNWFDKVLGSPSAGGRYQSKTRDKWAGYVLGNWQDENPAHTATVRSWLDKESRGKWKKTNGYRDTVDIKYIDAGYDLWTNAIRDALNEYEKSGGVRGTKEIRIVVNMRVMDSIDLAKTFEKRFNSFEKNWNWQINLTLKAFGKNCQRSSLSRIKLYAAYPALKALHGDMSEWVYYK
jgi:hypothetical protein